VALQWPGSELPRYHETWNVCLYVPSYFIVVTALVN